MYGGNADLVPVEEAALRRLAHQQRQEQARKKQGSRQLAAPNAEAAKGSRLGSAGRAISRWSHSTWSVVKKPAVVRRLNSSIVSDLCVPSESS